jgi:hypothetical protein
MLQHEQARFGQGHAPAIANQQALVQFHLELSHMPAQQGLLHPQCHGRSGEAAQFGYPHKRFNLFQVHGIREYKNE